MSYKVLALKYRPTSFAEVVGQTNVTRTLRNAIEQGKIGHAFLLSGARGVGKTTTARILAKALNCSRAEGPTASPCSTRTDEDRAKACDSCREIADGQSLDVQEIDGASNNSVDQVRELRESARYNPARDRFKVWIIDEVHMLSTGAFNALLKTLEEPPPRVKFIFATTEYHKIPETILSRCQQYDFRMIAARELALHLRSVADQEKIRVSDAALALIARAAEGSVRDGLSLFDQVLAFTGDEIPDADVAGLLGLVDRELLHRASKAIVEGDSLAMLELVESLADYGADYRNFARELLLHLREILLVFADAINGVPNAPDKIPYALGGLVVAGDDGIQTLTRLYRNDGGTFITEALGYSLQKTTPGMLGRAAFVRVEKKNTVIVGGAGDKKALAARIRNLRMLIEKAEYDFDRKQLEERLKEARRKTETDEAETEKRKAVAMLLDYSEHDRELLSCELHDGMVQDLSAALLRGMGYFTPFVAPHGKDGHMHPNRIFAALREWKNGFR